MTDGMTKKASKSSLLDLSLNTKACILENPYTDKLKRDGDVGSNTD